MSAQPSAASQGGVSNLNDSEGSGPSLAASDISPIMKGTEADKAADYANYFCSYSFLYHQVT